MKDNYKRKLHCVLICRTNEENYSRKYVSSHIRTHPYTHAQILQYTECRKTYSVTLDKRCYFRLLYWR